MARLPGARYGVVMAGFTFVDDVTRAFIGSAPSGANLAGYTTGSSGIMWGTADWVSHPTAIRIDQDFTASDGTADVLDVEAGAATAAGCADWVKRAMASFAVASRPGQRMPLIYVSLSQAGAVVSALKSGNVAGGVGLWLADWMNDRAQAEAMIGTTFGGFPVLGVQYRNAGPYDMDVFDTTWWATRSASHPSFPLTLGMSDGAATGLIHTLQAAVNRWAVKLGLGAVLAVDGVYGPMTSAAVAAAQVYFGERGQPAGTCDQQIYTDLAGAVPVAPPAPKDLHDLVTSTGAHALLQWDSVTGVSMYTYQLEYYKPQSGWVLALTKAVDSTSDTQLVAPATRFRWRVSSGTWSPWTEFATS